jgi:hypothetical protein
MESLKERLINEKERLIKEKEELSEKRNKLRGFIYTLEFKNLVPIQRSLMRIQLNAMNTYEQCLMERIEWLDFQ